MKFSFSPIPIGLIALALAGCDDSIRSERADALMFAESAQYPADCGSPISPFSTKADGIDHHAIVREFRLTKGGRLLFEGRPTTREGLANEIAISERLEPSPFLILSVDAGASCNELSNIRKFLAETKFCKDGNCAEGRDWETWKIQIAPGEFVDP